MSKETETLFEPAVRRLFQRLADGDLKVGTVRVLLRGKVMPNEPARLIKEGRWVSEGGYPSADEGARLAARDALRLDGWESEDA